MNCNENYQYIKLGFIILGISILFSCVHVPVKAQQNQDPQLVTAYNDQMVCGFTDQPLRRYVKIYAVDSPADPAYNRAVFSYQTFTQEFGESGAGECTPDAYTDLEGNYSGGQNGIINFPTPNDVFVTTCHVIEGKTINCNFEYEGDTWERVFFIENPDAFQISPTAVQPSLGSGCTPVVNGLTPAQPGDTVSPSTSYLDANGKETGIIQERWYFNGKEGTSFIWDGKEVKAELQWTCLDHSAFTKSYIILSSQLSSPPAASNPSETGIPTVEKPALTPAELAIILTSLVGLLGAGGIGIGLIIKNLPTAKKPGATPSAAAPNENYPKSNIPAISSIPPPVNVPAQTIPGAQKPPPMNDTPRPRPQGLTPEKRAELSGIRDQMKNEIEKIKAKWRADKDAIEKLSKLKKKNMLKFLTKKGFDVQQWVINSPVEAINNLTLDPVMEKVMQKHDTSQDAKIIVEINNRIEGLKNEMQSLINEVKYLQKEISKIDKVLSK